MTETRTMNRLLACAFAAATLFAGNALAMPVSAPTIPPLALPVSANCNAIGQQVAAQNGGTLASATPQMRGSSEVCVIVVVMPAQDGKRGRRAEFVVPRN